MGLHYKGPKVFITFSIYQPSLIFAGKAWGLSQVKPLTGPHLKGVRVFVIFSQLHPYLIPNEVPHKTPIVLTVNNRLGWEIDNDKHSRPLRLRISYFSKIFYGRGHRSIFRFLFGKFRQKVERNIWFHSLDNFLDCFAITNTYALHNNDFRIDYWYSLLQNTL